MRRLTAFVALLLLSSLVPGCPVYGDGEKACTSDSDCVDGYVCDIPSGDCQSFGSSTCNDPSDCGQNQTCSRSGVCEIGDCTWEGIGCVRGYSCAAHDGLWQCVSDGGTAGAGGAGDTEAGTGGATDAAGGAETASGAGGA